MYRNCSGFIGKSSDAKSADSKMIILFEVDFK